MAEPKIDIYQITNKAQRELIQFLTREDVIRTININYDKYGDVITKAVNKLFADDAIKNKFSRFYKLFRPTSLIKVQREIKLFLDGKRDAFNKNEIKEMIYSYSVVVLFLIIREQNDFYKEYINRLSQKVDDINQKFPLFLRDYDKIHAPVLSTIDEMDYDMTPEILCFYALEEEISKMS